jgi:hypothetical protein
MNRTAWMMLTALVALVALGTAGVDAPPAAAASDPGGCSCSANSLFGGCQQSGNCPCTCTCRFWGHCYCECAGASFANPAGD